MRWGTLSIEQPKYNTQSDQADKPVVAESIKQHGQVRNNPPKELDCAAKKDLEYDPNGHQQQSNLYNLTQPFFDFFQKAHLRLS